jgi:hypothetical protein
LSGIQTGRSLATKWEQRQWWCDAHCELNLTLTLSFASSPAHLPQHTGLLLLTSALGVLLGPVLGGAVFDQSLSFADAGISEEPALGGAYRLVYAVALALCAVDVVARAVWCAVVCCKREPSAASDDEKVCNSIAHSQHGLCSCSNGGMFWLCCVTEPGSTFTSCAASAVAYSNHRSRAPPIHSASTGTCPYP